ncbi:IS66 family insertion sequence element accessory protein TnpA [Chitinophaga sp. LS1]|uniref:IS66 family insertion sequence element accessory protein TnpA n=1 Tax=Chitinophaga sp. LS1 TaxID=3051176 RepID=UPI002AABBC6C|nr:hypothetical protein [Chitinophaga sp. LS1]WPV67056.1 hypothetical protein QQL36_35280 [Chitinophaga sp. LS1]
MRTKKSQVNKEEYMFSLIAEQATSGQSIKSFCARHGIPSGKWFYWQKRYQQRNLEAHSENGSFTLLQISPDVVSSIDSAIFAEYKGMKIYRPVPASFLKELIG